MRLSVLSKVFKIFQCVVVGKILEDVLVVTISDLPGDGVGPISTVVLDVLKHLMRCYIRISILVVVDA